MSEEARLAMVLGEISDLLATHGHEEFAEALRGQLQILVREDASPDDLKEVRKRLHRAITGMGGILDRWPIAPTHEESVRIQTKLSHLSDELYELTA